MGIVIFAQIVLTLLAFSAAIVAAVWARAARENGKETRDLIEQLLAAFRNAHPYPTGTAVVTGASPVPEVRPAPDPAPVAARAVVPLDLTAEEVAAGRGRLPVEPVPVPPAAPVAAPPAPVAAREPAVPSTRRPPPHKPPVRVAEPAPSTVPKASTDRKVRTWDRPFRPTAEQVAEARKAHAEASEDGDDDKTQVFAAPKRLKTLVSEGAAPEVPPASEPRAIPVERLGDLDAADRARLDALAAEHGLTPDEMMLRTINTGLAKEDLDGGPPSSKPRQK
jgi:hypothetical protein